MLKQTLKNVITTTTTTASTIIRCAEATIDTIQDPQVKQAWTAYKHDVKHISAKKREELNKLYKHFFTKYDKIQKLSKEAKKIANDQLNGVIKTSFAYHLKNNACLKRIVKSN